MSHVDEGLLHAYLDGELDERRAGEIEEHVALCKRCDGLFEETIRAHARAGELMAEAGAGEDAAPAWSELERRAAEAAARDAREATLGAERPPSFLVPGLAWAATLVLAFFLGWQASERSASQGPTWTLDGERARPATSDEARGAAGEWVARDERAAPHAPQEAAADAEQTTQDAKVAGQTAEDALAENVEEEAAPRQRRAAEPTGSVAAPPVSPPAERRLLDRSVRESVTTEEAVPSVAANDGQLAAAPPFARKEAPTRSTDPFRPIAPRDIVSWMAAAPLRLPLAELRQVAVGPASAFPGLAGRPVLRLVYDVTDISAPVVVLQQWLDDESRTRPQQAVELQPSPRATAAPEADRERGVEDATIRNEAVMAKSAATLPFPTGIEQALLTVRPDGRRAISWLDRRGYLVVIEADAPEARLRELAGSLEPGSR